MEHGKRSYNEIPVMDQRSTELTKILPEKLYLTASILNFSGYVFN